MDWAKRYGRTGFHSGIGGDRPFNSPNKPTLDVSKADYDRIKNANVLPSYYSRSDRGNIPNNKKQIVFWNENYERPLPQNEQVYGDGDDAIPFAASRIKKRNYIKEYLDKEDPVLKFEDAMGQYPEDWSKRKQRRDALTNNPFQEMAEDDFPIERGYDGQRLTQAQVKRSKFRQAMLVSRPEFGRSPDYSASSPVRGQPLQIQAPRERSVEPQRAPIIPIAQLPRNQQLAIERVRGLVGLPQ
jgi:hypothetical protein